MSERPGYAHPAGHRRGKLVVLAIFAMGLGLGLVSLMFRPVATKRPATRPATAPVGHATTSPT